MMRLGRRVSLLVAFYMLASAATGYAARWCCGRDGSAREQATHGLLWAVRYRKDRFSDETGEWEVVGRPQTSAAGKNAHVRVRLVAQPTVAEECLFPEVESLATRMKGLALCGADLFYSFFGYVLQ